MSTAAADVFLSYSRADAPAVRQIQASLKQAGLATFLDRDQLPAGQPWLSALEQGIARCAMDKGRSNFSGSPCLICDGEWLFVLTRGAELGCAGGFAVVPFRRHFPFATLVLETDRFCLLQRSGAGQTPP